MLKGKMIEEIYNQKENFQLNSQNLLQKIINKQLEKIKTKNPKIISYLCLKRNKNKTFWLKITNSYANLDETEGDSSPHVLEGFYVSITNENDYLHIAYHKPINKNIFDKMIDYLNRTKELSIHDFIKYIERNMNRKADWLDKNF